MQTSKEDALQFIEFGIGGGPTGDETADGVMAVGLPEVGKLYLTPQTFSLFVVHDHKLLVGGGIDQELIALADEERLHAHRRLDGLLGELEVKVIGEKGFELQTDQGTLGNHGPMLLLDGEEVLVGILVGEDHRLATEGADLRAADVEDIAMAGEIGQGDVVAFCHQTVTETGPVDIKWYFVTLADLIDVVELTGRIKRTQLGGEGDIYQSRMDGVILVSVVHIVVEVFFEHCRLHLSIGIGEGDDLMLRKLHGTRLMDIDMTTAHTDDALVLIEHRVDGGGVGLGTAGEEENLGIGQPASLTDAVLGSLTEFVETVGCGFGIVVFHQVVEHLLTSPVIIVTFE